MGNIFKVKLRGFEFEFKTKPGVFSKGGLDLGSQLLIENMQIEDNTMVADLGCGSGVIGFAAARLNRLGHVHLLDVNLRVIELAKENVILNDFKNAEVFLSDLFSADQNRTYHTILSNPSQHLGNEFLDEIARECSNHLKPQGTVYWVVQKHVKPVIEKLFKKYFGNCTIVAHGKEHIVLTGVKNG